MAKPTTILFVPGAWHTEAHVRPITPFLASRGYDIVPIRLATNSTGLTPPPTIEDSSKKIQQAIRSVIASNHHVILIAHSASGIACAHAVAEFLSVATSPEAENLSLICISTFWNLERALHVGDWFSLDLETMEARVTEKMMAAFYNDMSESEARVFWNDLVGCTVAPVPEITTGWQQRTLAYVVCLDDRAHVVERQRVEAEENGLRVVEFQGGHCPFISRPEEFARMLDGIIQR